MEDSKVAASNMINKDHAEVVLSSWRGLEAVTINMSQLKEAERRVVETKTINPSTYTELEFVMNKSYEEIRKNLSKVGYQIVKTENEFNKIKSLLLLDKYPEFLKGRSSKADNAATRDAFLTMDPELDEAKERLDALRALESFLEGRAKVMENVCQYMRNTIRLYIRSGAIDLPYKPD